MNNPVVFSSLANFSTVLSSDACLLFASERKFKMVPFALDEFIRVLHVNVYPSSDNLTSLEVDLIVFKFDVDLSVLVHFLFKFN